MVGVTGQQRMLNHPRHLILPLQFPGVCVLLIFTVDYSMYLIWTLVFTAHFPFYMIELTDINSSMSNDPSLCNSLVCTSISQRSYKTDGCLLPTPQLYFRFCCTCTFLHYFFLKFYNEFILYPEFLALLATYLCQRLTVLQESFKMANFLKYKKLATSVVKIYLNTLITRRCQAFVRFNNRFIFLIADF
jgi:hypothetical protein